MHDEKLKGDKAEYESALTTAEKGDGTKDIDPTHNESPTYEELNDTKTTSNGTTKLVIEEDGRKDTKTARQELGEHQCPTDLHYGPLVSD